MSVSTSGPPASSGFFGDLGRDTLTGPGLASWDFSAFKTTTLHERLSLQFRAEIFNLFNRWNVIRVNNIFGEGPAPLATFLAPVAGITNVDPGRQVQFVVKFTF